MARVLMAPHAPTTGVAHVGACLAVAERLRARGHEVAFAYGGSREELIVGAGFGVHRVEEVRPEREWAGWYADAADLRRSVESHARVIEELGPDAIVTSSGLAARIAAAAAGVPELALVHHLSLTRFARATGTGIWRRRLRDARRPRRALRVARNRLRRTRAGGAPGGAVPSPARVVRAELGLEPDERDLGLAVAVACTTTPFLDPARGLPAHWRYTGPIGWSAPDGPSEAVERGARPLVYVTQGTTGSPELLRRAVLALSREPIDVLATTAALCDPAEIEAIAPNVRAERFLPGDACLAACDVAVVHGGHLTTAAAVAMPRPVAVLPSRPDQIAWLDRAERLGVGIGLWPDPSEPAIRAAVRRLLARPAYRARGEALAARLRDWDGAGSAADLAEELATRATSAAAAAGSVPRSSGSAQR